MRFLATHNLIVKNLTTRATYSAYTTRNDTSAEWDLEFRPTQKLFLVREALCHYPSAAPKCIFQHVINDKYAASNPDSVTLFLNVRIRFHLQASSTIYQVDTDIQHRCIFSCKLWTGNTLFGKVEGVTLLHKISKQHVYLCV